MKILLLDIETAPNVAHVWCLWQQNVGLPQIIEAGYVMCYAAKWLGERVTYFASVVDGERKMLAGVHKLMGEADAICHYNGARFDIPTLNREFIVNGYLPPSPAKNIDLLKVARNKFKFPSNKLDYVAKVLGVEQKLKHRGHQLWIDCMAGKKEAWEEMRRYNIQDVNVLEQVYEKMLPWIGNHPNVGVYDDVPDVCPNCGGSHFMRRGVAVAQLLKYHRFQCKDCGKWVRGTKTISDRGVERLVGLN